MTQYVKEIWYCNCCGKGFEIDSFRRQPHCSYIIFCDTCKPLFGGNGNIAQLPKTEKTFDESGFAL